MCLMYPGTDDPASKLAKPFYELKFWPDIKERPLLTFAIDIHHSSPQLGIILSLVWNQISNVLSSLQGALETFALKWIIRGPDRLTQRSNDLLGQEPATT